MNDSRCDDAGTAADYKNAADDMKSFAGAAPPRPRGPLRPGDHHSELFKGTHDYEELPSPKGLPEYVYRRRYTSNDSLASAVSL